MDTHEEDSEPMPPRSDHTVFQDLRARNERRRALRPAHAERKQRIERVIEAARAHARLAKPFGPRHSRPTSD